MLNGNEMILRIGKELRQFRYAGFVLSVALSPDGTKVLICSEGARLLDLATGREIRRFGGLQPDSVGIARFSPDGTTLVTAGTQIADHVASRDPLATLIGR
jgi:WD40 repeat protein